MTTHRSQSAMVSLSVHVGLIALVLLLSRQAMVDGVKPLFTSTVPLYAPRLVTPLKGNAGGGGGMHQDAPATQGKLPKVAPQFVPPMVQVENRQPKLAMEMTVESAPDLTASSMTNIGDPLSKFVGSSAGSGGPLGIGNGPGTGIGNRRGAGAGPGDGGINGTVYEVGKGITVPVLVTKVEPEFSEEARKARHSGLVKIRIDVDVNGHARNLRLVQGLGMGLDERAMEAVSKWVFKPGTKDGKPVPVTALVDVMFHLL